MSDNQKYEQRRFAIDGIKNTGFFYTKSLVDGKYKLPIPGQSVCCRSSD